MSDNPIYFGPRLRRLRRKLGLTQTAMGQDLGFSSSYIALMERNQRPLTAAILLKLAEVYQIDLGEFVGDGGQGQIKRVEDMLKDPFFADLDLGAGEPHDLVHSLPGMTEALLRLYHAYQEGLASLSQRRGQASGAPDAVDETRAFLGANHNYFPVLDDGAERLAKELGGRQGFEAHLRDKHGYEVRLMPSDLMNGALRRFELHRRELHIDVGASPSTIGFQLALQIVYLEFGDKLDAALRGGQFSSEDAKRIARRALANYAAAALLMPYKAMLREAVAAKYDIERLGRTFGTSFEQVAHRLTTLNKPGAEGISFFFVRIDRAGNVSKRFGSSDFPFALLGAGCPRWSLYETFSRPDTILTEMIELPETGAFFSVARTVTTGGGSFGAERVRRAVALCCDAKDAGQLIYHRAAETTTPTPIGLGCQLCHRADCIARATPPLGRVLGADDFRRMHAPFGFADE